MAWRVCIALLGLLLGLASGPLFGGEAADEETEPERPVMTQCQLAVAIVRALGLEDQVDVQKGPLGYIDYLRGKGVEPLLKWDCNAPVTREVLAVVVVQALGLTDEVEDLTDPESYITALEERDISLADVRRVLSNIQVLNVLAIIVLRSPMAAWYETDLTPITGQ